MHDLPTILMFLKAPRPGTVKTRLAAEVGADEAARVYRLLAERQLRAIPLEYPLRILYAPDDALDEMQAWLGDRFLYEAQDGADLGQRMENAAAGAFSDGETACLLIGADCPTLDAITLNAATNRLADGANPVFGPASDGGYYLLGLNTIVPELFRGIEWGTDTVLQTSLRKAEQAGFTYELLDTKDDIDRLCDLKRAVRSGAIAYDLQQPLF